jgi:hypothetical protein
MTTPKPPGPPIGISLGFNCTAAVYGVQHGLRNTREHGQKTCPFDECITEYEGMLACLSSDFEGFTDPDNLELREGPSPPGTRGETLIYHKKYHIVFNHESPGHGNLYKTQAWPGGRTHFVDDGFARFRERYDARIASFRAYVSAPGARVRFLVAKETPDVSALHAVLRTSYPALAYEVVHVLLDERALRQQASMRAVGLDV